MDQFSEDFVLELVGELKGFVRKNQLVEFETVTRHLFEKHGYDWGTFELSLKEREAPPVNRYRGIGVKSSKKGEGMRMYKTSRWLFTT